MGEEKGYQPSPEKLYRDDTEDLLERNRREELMQTEEGRKTLDAQIYMPPIDELQREGKTQARERALQAISSKEFERNEINEQIHKAALEYEILLLRLYAKRKERHQYGLESDDLISCLMNIVENMRQTTRLTPDSEVREELGKPLSDSQYGSLLRIIREAREKIIKLNTTRVKK